MFNTIVLEIAIGIIFVFLVYSLLASAINEIIAAMIAQRGRMLLRGIQKMLNGESIYWWHNLEKIFRKDIFRRSLPPRHRRFKNSLAEAFRKHTIFKRLGKDGRPAYLSDTQFSTILLDILHQKSKEGATAVDTGQVFEARSFNSVKAGIVKVLNELTAKETGKEDCRANDKKCYEKRRDELHELFSVLLDQANGDLLRLKMLVEQWYNEMMDRVTGWYKKQTHQILFFIGLFLAFIFNADSIAIINKLSTDKTSRETLVTLADSYIKNHPRPDSVYKAGGMGKIARDTLERVDSTNYRLADSVIRKVYRDARRNADTVNTILGLGWGDYGRNKDVKAPGFWRKIGYVLQSVFTSPRKIFGLLITALAISLGASFWFDLLNKLVNLRMSGKTAEESKKTKPSVAANAATNPNQPLPGSVG